MHPIFEEIRKQLRLNHDARSAAKYRWKAEQWWEAFVFTFYYGPKHGRQPGADDLLFLVFDAGFLAATDTPYTVIRRMEELPTEFHKGGTQYHKIDWRKTLELNLVMQTSYTITVAICTAEEIPFMSSAAPFSNGSSVKVAKRVHASPITVGLDLAHEKADTAAVCYPDICFAVEDYEEAFSSLVLTEESQRFCVMLCTSQDPPPEPSPASTQGGEVTQGEAGAETVIHDPLLHPSTALERTPERVSSKEFPQEESGEIRVFGGFVLFDQVKCGLLGKDHCIPRRILQERIIPMKGPGGEGRAEVFTSIDVASMAPPPVSYPTPESDGELQWPDKPRSFLQKGWESARDLMRRFGSENLESVVDITDETDLKFRCSLITLTLPVSVVALKILEC